MTSGWVSPTCGLSNSDTFGEGASILTRVVSVEEDMVLEEAVIEAEDRP